MSYAQIKDLAPALFKRYCEVKPETFHQMVSVSMTAGVQLGSDWNT
jgi:hypothetical protein